MGLYDKTIGEDGCRFDVGIGLPLRIGRWNLFQIVPMHYYSLERSTPVRFCATTKKPDKKTMDQAQKLGSNKNEVVNLWDATRNRNPQKFANQQNQPLLNN
ncbi:MAG: hypothetical protein ABS44_03705 [Chryseobacterium sp. SCN 40-13]|nr:MAG: hypothetical protein ABS44_03705 [Chryseobacterium sp. SCN 40-13]